MCGLERVNPLKQSIGKAIELVQKAIVLDDTFAEAHGLLGFLYSMTRQHDKAIAQAEKAVALNPNSADVTYDDWVRHLVLLAGGRNPFRNIRKRYVLILSRRICTYGV